MLFTKHFNFRNLNIFKHSFCNLRVFVFIFLVIYILETFSFAQYTDDLSSQNDIAFPLVVESYIQFLQSPSFQLWKIACDDMQNQYMWNGETIGISFIYFNHININMDWMSLESQHKLVSYRGKDKNIGSDWFQNILSNQKNELKNEIGRVKRFDLSNYDVALDHEKKEYFNITKRMFDVYFDIINQDVKDILTSEELLKFRKLEVQYFFELGLPSQTMYELLDLSTEQKSKMKATKDKMTPKFNIIVQETNNLKMEYSKAIIDILVRENKKGGILSLDNFEAVNVNAINEINENSEWKMKIISNIKKRRDFATQARLVFLEILYDTQIEKLQNLINDSPVPVKKTVSSISGLSEDQMFSLWYRSSLLWCPYKVDLKALLRQN